MAKVLVVGGAGYVGGWLVDSLLADSGHAVRVYDNLTYEDSYLKPVDFIYGDARDLKTLLPNLQWADVVIWLAAIVGDPACALNPEETMEVNSNAVKLLMDNFAGRVIFTSTCSVYGAQESELDEESPLKPMSLYAESKIRAEKELVRSERALVLRLGTLFGLGDNHSRLRADLVLNVLTARAVFEKRMTVFGGEQYRPLLHVRDVSTAILPHIDSSVTGVFNLHSENLTIKQLAGRIQELVPDSEVIYSDSSFEDSRNYAVSGVLAREKLRFTPRFTVEDGIAQVRDALEDRRIPDITLPKFSNVAALKQRGVA